MSNNKSTTLSVSDIPRFNGRNFQGWSEKMIGVFMMAKVYEVVNRNTTAPTESELLAVPTAPANITATTAVDVASRLNAMWTQYNVQIQGYNHTLDSYNRRLSAWKDNNSQAMGILNRALDIGIWDQVKEKTAAESWTWLKTKYAKHSHLELMEHFRFIKDQKINLSDSNPQLAAFMHHYQAIPTKMISSSMASIILLSNLPMTTNPGQESVYQCLLKASFKEETVASLELESLMESIRDVWAACFGGFPAHTQPHKGAVYDKGKAPANQQPKQKQQVQVQRH